MAKEKLKVFLLIRYLQRSGAPKILLWLANELACKGYDVTLFCFSDILEVEVPKSVRLIHEDLGRCNFFSKVRRLRKHLNEANPDVSISFLLDANIYNIFACLGLKTKSVVCERNDPFKPGYYKLKFWKPWFRFADGAVYQLPKVADYYNNIKGKTAVIPNPIGKVDVKVNRPFPERENIIVSVGRIDIFQKRHDVLIKAFAEFRKYHPSYKLILYGAGFERDKQKLLKLIHELDVSDCVQLAGSVSHVIEKLVNCKFFVLSSDFEGIPNALIEAMVAGLPCISTDCSPGGARLLIEDGRNGLIAPVGDVECLSEKMRYMADHPVIADQLGNEAKDIATRFSGHKIIDMWDNYIQTLQL